MHHPAACQNKVVKMNNEIKNNKSATGLAFAVLCLCYMIPNYAQYQISPWGAQIIEQYNLELSQLSSLFSAPMIPAIFLSLAGGLLLDRFGIKSVIGIGLVVTAAGCIMRIFSTSYFPLFLGTMMTGLSACFINAGGGKIVGSLYEAKEVPGKMGVLMAVSTAAMTIANFTSPYFGSLLNTFLASSLFACVGLILWILFIKSPNRETKDIGVSEPSMSTCLNVAIKNRNVWIIAFALFFIMAGNVVIGSFLPTALGARDISTTVSGYIAAAYTIGNFLGCLTAPICISKLKSQKKVLVLFGIFASIGIAFAWMIPQTALLAAGMLLTGNFLGGMIPTLMALPVQFPEIGPVYAGTTGGFIGTIQLLGAVLLPSYLLAPIASGSFTVLFVLGGICMILAAVFSACIHGID